MARRRGLSCGVAAAAAAGVALCLTFYPQPAVAREPIWGAGANGANDANFDLKSGSLHSRKSPGAPRSAEGIRKRLAAGIGTTPIQKDVPGIAGGQDNSTESQDHAARGTCKRREGWSDGGSTTGDGDICHAGERVSGPDTHKDAHQGRGREETGQRFAGTAEERRTEAPFVPDEDRLGLHHRPPTSSGITDGKEPQGFLPGDGVVGTPSSHELQRAPEHDPWEGYQIIAQADPVASWEILREVSDSRTYPGFRGNIQIYLTSFHAKA